MTGPKEEISQDIQVAKACWSRLGDLPLIEQTWPSGQTLTALDALRRWTPETFEKLRTRHTLIDQFGAVPIVAVAGLLNSGKSSLSAAFLSPAGRSRTLRGAGQKEGSQRFTLWIPQAWRDDQDFFDALIALLGSVFEREPEWLAEDPAAAHEQQNDVDKLGCPLLAIDPKLSDFRLSILDCPDIQRAPSADKTTVDAARIDMVSRAASLCSAVFVVLTRSQLETRTLRTILDAMPHAYRIHAVNLMKDESAAEVHDEAVRALGLSAAEPVYGAYDFLLASYENRTPSWDPNRSRSIEERLKQSEPCFFELRPANERQGPVSEERSLTVLAHSLTPQAIKSRRLQELVGEFYQTIQKGLDQLANELDERGQTLGKASEDLRNECFRLLSREGRIQIKMSPEIVCAMEASLERTAKRQYKWLLLPSRKFFQAAQKLIEKGREFSPLPGKELRAKKAELEAKWQVRSEGKIAQGTITTEDLQRVLSLWSGSSGDYRAPEYWKASAESILQRFVSEDKTNLTEAEWDALTGPLWDELPKRARMKLVASAFLMLGGLLLAFVDGGISLISIQAMDLLGGIGVVASLGVSLKGAKAFEEVLEEKIGRQQVANFHAIVCDFVGVPRCQATKHFPEPTIPSKPRQPTYGVSDRGWSVHRINPESLKEIRSYGR